MSEKLEKLEWSKDYELRSWIEAIRNTPKGWRLPTIDELENSDSSSFKQKTYLSSQIVVGTWAAGFNFYTKQKCMVFKGSDAYYVRYVKI